MPEGHRRRGALPRARRGLARPNWAGAGTVMVNEEALSRIVRVLVALVEGAGALIFAGAAYEFLRFCVVSLRARRMQALVPCGRASALGREGVLWAGSRTCRRERGRRAEGGRELRTRRLTSSTCRGRTSFACRRPTRSRRRRSARIVASCWAMFLRTRPAGTITARPRSSGWANGLRRPGSSTERRRKAAASELVTRLSITPQAPAGLGLRPHRRSRPFDRGALARFALRHLLVDQ
ncbi:hypothetical protein BH23ACT12_BH23ACT12_17460 [soil metagenome]